MKVSTKYSDRLSLLSKQQIKTKSHYYKRGFTKHPQNKSLEEQQLNAIDKEMEAHLQKLRQEAFADLRAQLENYNYDFIHRMQCIENGGGSTCTQEDSDMESLVDSLCTSTVKDYSLLIEWEEGAKNNRREREDEEGEHGNLW